MKKLLIGGTLAMALGLVAFVGFPRFQEQARAKEAHALLKGIYHAAKAFHKEYGYYPNTLKKIGFVPVGTLNFNFYYLYIRLKLARSQSSMDVYLS